MRIPDPPKNAREALERCRDAAYHNRKIYDRVSELRQAYSHRPIRSPHWGVTISEEAPLCIDWLWVALANATDAALACPEINDDVLEKFNEQCRGVAATSRMLLAYLNESYSSVTPLNTLIGDLDGINRIASEIPERVKNLVSVP